jgi:hypothetical protein
MKNKRQKKDGNTNNLSNRKLDFEDLKNHNNKQNTTADEKIDTRETIKPVSSTSWYKRKNDSAPLILPQPKVEDHKLKRIKNKQNDFAQEKENEFMESNPSSHKKSKASNGKSKALNEDELFQREKRISSMMNQFSSMLKFDGAFSSKENVTDKLEELLSFNNEASAISEESYLLEGEFSTNYEGIIAKKFKFDAGGENSLDDECLIEMEKTSSILEEAQSNEEEPTLESEFTAMLEERTVWEEAGSKEEKSSLESMFTAMLEETSPCWEEAESNEEEPTLESGFAAMLEDECSLEEEYELIEEESTLESEYTTLLEEESSEGESQSNKEEPTLESEYTMLLEEESPEEEESQSNKEEPTLESEYTMLLEEESPEEEESQSNKEEPTLESEYTKLLEEESPEEESPEEESQLNEEGTKLESEYTMLLEEEFSEEEESQLNEEGTKLESEFIEMLEDDSTEGEENQSIKEKNKGNLLEEKFSSELEEDSTEREEWEASTSKKCPSSEKHEFERELLAEESEEDDYCHSPQEPILAEDCSKKENLPLVKLPVLLAQVNIDVDMFDSLELEFPIAKITKIDWLLESLECRVLLPSTTVFLKGVLIADIQYVKEHKHLLHTVKIPVPWEKIISIEWRYPPDLASSSKKEFMFGSLDCNEPSTHYEFCQKFADKIKYDLRSVKLVWHEEGISKKDLPLLSIQGIANLTIDLFQIQNIDLNSFKGFL